MILWSWIALVDRPLHAVLVSVFEKDALQGSWFDLPDNPETAKMGLVLNFPEGGRGLRAAESSIPEGGASVILFTGVRYVRLTTPESDQKNEDQGGGGMPPAGGRPPRRSTRTRRA